MISRPFGYHITGGQFLGTSLSSAAAEGFTAAQIFLGPPKTFKISPITPFERQIFKQIKAETGIKVFVHAPYVLHAFAKPANVEKNNQALLEMLKEARDLGLDGFVIHMGGTKWYEENGDYLEIARHLMNTLQPGVVTQQGCPILFENCANGNEMSGSLPVIINLLDRLHYDGYNVGLCLDTLHAWAWGHDFREPTGLSAILNEGVKKHLKLIHLNSGPEKATCGGKFDRHESIAKGIIPVPCLLDLLVGLPGVPAIAERDSVLDVIEDWEFVKKADATISGGDSI